MAGGSALKPGQKRPQLPPPMMLKPKWGAIPESTAPATLAEASPATASPSSAGGLTSDRLRGRMVQRLMQQGIRDTRVLAAMAAVPRHVFVDPALASRAYEDSALPIGHGQTISQPYVVARAIELALLHLPGLAPKLSTSDPKADRKTRPVGVGRVLEIGGGCGYQASVLAQIFDEVYSIERIAGLHQQARRNLFGLKLPNLHLLHADGMALPPGLGQFRAIFLAAGMPSIPEHLLRELEPGGVLVAPIGAPTQRLVVVRVPPDTPKGIAPVYERREFEEVSFVPILRGIQT